MDRLKNCMCASLALIVFSIFINGCTTPLIVGGMSTASSGATSVSGSGTKIESYQIADYKTVISATLQAAKTLALNVKKETIDIDQASFRFSDNNDRTVDVTIEQRTETMTYIQVDSGWFGPLGMGRLLMRQILAELEASGQSLEE
ncbi:MAG: DUF3568 family protein [Deltaproteobacteria bacterium]|nr:DUF3568 family protein [Deltaproteobacteria bacterium]